MSERGQTNARTAIIVVVVVIVIAGLGVAMIGGLGGGRRCGDYTKAGTGYTHTPGRGEYRRDGQNYVFVGCGRNNTGGVFGFGSSTNGSGSTTRGGGPGSGK